MLWDCFQNYFESRMRNTPGIDNKVKQPHPYIGIFRKGYGRNDKRFCDTVSGCFQKRCY